MKLMLFQNSSNILNYSNNVDNNCRNFSSWERSSQIWLSRFDITPTWKLLMPYLFYNVNNFLLISQCQWFPTNFIMAWHYQNLVIPNVNWTSPNILRGHRSIAGASNEGYPKVREDFTITEKAPNRAFSWLKACFHF